MVKNFYKKIQGKERGMLIKVVAGVLMGFAAGAAAKGFTSTGDGEGSLRGLAMLAAVSSIAFVLYTFIAYRAAFGFAAIGELVVGAFCAGFLAREWLVRMANFSPILLILAWIMAT